MSVIDFRLGRSPFCFSNIERESVDAMFTDPPYGTSTEGTGYGRRQLTEDRTGRHIENDTDLSEVRAVLPPMMKFLKPDAWVAVFCSPRRRAELDTILRDNCGLELFGEIVWDKMQVGLGYWIRYKHETIVIARRGKPVMAEDAIQSIIHVPMPRSRERHPHAKPLALLTPLLTWLCPEAGTVIDPFAGEGRLGVVAYRTGRNYIGAEMSEDWFLKGRRLIQDASFTGGEDERGQGAFL